jgi:hypothetical protein
VARTALFRVEADGSLTILSVELDPDLVTNIVVQTAHDEASAFVNTFSPLLQHCWDATTIFGYYISPIPRTLSLPGHKIHTRDV